MNMFRLPPMFPRSLLIAGVCASFKLHPRVARVCDLRVAALLLVLRWDARLWQSSWSPVASTDCSAPPATGAALTVVTSCLWRRVLQLSVHKSAFMILGIMRFAQQSHQLFRECARACLCVHSNVVDAVDAFLTSWGAIFLCACVVVVVPVLLLSLFCSCVCVCMCVCVCVLLATPGLGTHLVRSSAN